MYKVIIVEDEWFTRNSLINAIQWSKADCEIVADAQDGREAIGLIKELTPDIIISDIKMDEMDGLELCQYVNVNHPEMKIILITGYSEFEYAQKAVKLGVSDFLLKPTDPDKLLDAVVRVTREIADKRLRQEEFTRLQKIVEENIPSLREKFILELVNGKQFDTTEMLQKQVFLGIDTDSFHIITGEIDDWNEFLNKYDEKQQQVIKLMIREISERAMNQFGTGCFIEKESNLFVIYAKCADAANLAEYIQQRVMDITETSVSIGISQLASGLHNIMNGYEQAMEALKHKFYIGRNCIVSYQDIKKESIFSDALPFRHVNNSIDGIIESIKIGNSEEALERTDALFAEIVSLKNESHHYIRNIAFEIIVLLQRFLLHTEEEPTKIFLASDTYTKIYNTKTLSDIKTLLKDLILRVGNLVQEKNKKMSESVVNKIIEYLRRNFSGDITLDDLGKIVFMNPKYICRLIKKETGSNFSDILLDIRIEKAKELLKDPELKAFEIAEKVGIKDSRYFSKVFRKSVGMTPTEFKQQFA